jgi:3-phosphoshikimate 1-carboxyvinyltransferase
VTHRALVCSALAEGYSVIREPLISEDTEATRRVLEQLGVGISRKDGAWKVAGGSLRKPEFDLHCGESGTTLRLVTALCSLVDGECKLIGGPSLSKRPIGPLVDGLKQLGTECESTGGLPPVTVKGKGRLPGGEAVLPGDISSQFVSAILIAAPRGEKDTTLRLTTRLESRPYIELTMEVQHIFGVSVEASEGMEKFRIERQSYRPANVTVERDWSAAAFLLGAGALAGKVTVEDLNMGSSQGDAAILAILDEMGATVVCMGDSITVEMAPLSGIELDLSDSPDLFPVVASLCAAASGQSVLRGLRRLRLKESDRVAAMTGGLVGMGVRCELVGDILTIEGGSPKGCVIDPWGDHRIAMAFSILSLAAEGETTILDAECVSKSYPGFWGDLEALGVELRRDADE